MSLKKFELSVFKAPLLELASQCCHKMSTKKHILISRPNLLVHRREQHELGDERLVECNICGFKSKGLRNLRKHLQIHDDESLKKVQMTTAASCADHLLTILTTSNNGLHTFETVAFTSVLG